MKTVSISLTSTDVDALLDVQQQLGDRVVFDPALRRFPTSVPGVQMFEWRGKVTVRDIGEMPRTDGDGVV